MRDNLVRDPLVGITSSKAFRIGVYLYVAEKQARMVRSKSRTNQLPGEKLIVCRMQRFTPAPPEATDQLSPAFAPAIRAGGCRAILASAVPDKFLAKCLRRIVKVVCTLIFKLST